jgi:hypothetical protein
MNRFRWKIDSDVIDASPVTVIKNVFDEKKCKELSEQIVIFRDSLEKNNPFQEDSNPNCWRGFPHLAPQGTAGLSEENKKLIHDCIIEACNIYKQTWVAPKNLKTISAFQNLFDQSKFEIQAWANINDQGGANIAHSHTGSLFSGVLYFQAQNTGAIEFYNQNYLYGVTHPLWPYHGGMTHNPEDGDMILFPAYLLHSVQANPNQKQRINMAFNVNYARNMNYDISSNR